MTSSHMKKIAVAIALTAMAPSLYAQSDSIPSADSVAVPHPALVKISVGTFRGAPAQSAELETQMLMGTPVQVDTIAGEWNRIALPEEGGNIWVNESAIQRLTPDQLDAWKQSDRHIVIWTMPVYMTTQPESPHPGNIVTDLVFGDVLEAAPCGKKCDKHKSTDDKYIRLKTPDGRIGFVESKYVITLTDWISREPDVDSILAYAEVMMGTPYLWGGTSAKMVDCSGFTSICYMTGGGIRLPRNSRQQATTGIEVDFSNLANIQRGDLIFFTNPETGNINHVGIAMGNDKIIHASGEVKVNSLDPTAPDYINRPIKCVRRVLGHLGGKARRYADLPVYFNQESR